MVGQMTLCVDQMERGSLFSNAASISLDGYRQWNEIFENVPLISKILDVAEHMFENWSDGKQGACKSSLSSLVASCALSLFLASVESLSLSLSLSLSFDSMFSAKCVNARNRGGSHYGFNFSLLVVNLANPLWRLLGVQSTEVRQRKKIALYTTKEKRWRRRLLVPASIQHRHANFHSRRQQSTRQINVFHSTPI